MKRIFILLLALLLIVPHSVQRANAKEWVWIDGKESTCTECGVLTCYYDEENDQYYNLVGEKIYGCTQAPSGHHFESFEKGTKCDDCDATLLIGGLVEEGSSVQYSIASDGTYTIIGDYGNVYTKDVSLNSYKFKYYEDGESKTYLDDVTRIVCGVGVRNIWYIGSGFVNVQELYLSEHTNIFFNTFYGAHPEVVVVDSFNKWFDSRNNCNAIIRTSMNQVCAMFESSDISVGGIKEIYYCATSSDFDNLYIPKNITFIENEAFFDSAFKTIKVDPDNQYFDSRNDCNALIETETDTLMKASSSTFIPVGIKNLASDSFSYCKINELEIPEGVDELLYATFVNSSIGTLIIPSTISAIDENAFVSTQINNVVVSEHNPIYDCRDNCCSLIDTAANSLIILGKDGFIPDTVETINGEAICGRIDRLTIPHSVKKIEDYGFYETEIEELTIETDELEHGDQTISWVHKLNISPNIKMTSVGHYNKDSRGFFWTCRILTLTVSNGTDFIDYTEENYKDGLIQRYTNPGTIVKIEQGCTSLGDRMFKGLTFDTTIDIPDSVGDLGIDTFKGFNGTVHFKDNQFTDEQIAAAGLTPDQILHYFVGDLDGDEIVTDSDAIYLLMYTFFPDKYPINQPTDFDNDGDITDSDAIYLLMHTFFPNKYPIE